MHIFTSLREDEKQICLHQHALTNLLYLEVRSYIQYLLCKKYTEGTEKKERKWRRSFIIAFFATVYNTLALKLILWQQNQILYTICLLNKITLIRHYGLTTQLVISWHHIPCRNCRNALWKPIWPTVMYIYPSHFWSTSQTISFRHALLGCSVSPKQRFSYKTSNTVCAMSHHMKRINAKC
jgi:hypothetical protein